MMACGLLLAIPKPAQAQNADSSWRHGNHAPQSSQHYAFELRFGPYVPRIDDDFRGSTIPPYQSVFGSDKRVTFGVEVDWQALRIPMVGTLGPGIGWSYTHMSAPAVFATSDNAGTNTTFVTRTPSAETTTLSIMPMYAVAVLRLDVLARETPVPLVAYGKAGIGYGIWWAGNDVETQLRGHSWGSHFALGGMLLLDALDSHAATELDNETGINNSYFFFEWMDARLGGSSTPDPSVLRIGTSTWMMGLAVEM